MSSAFPQPTQLDPFGPAAAAMPIPERGTHIPAFYVRNPHRDMDLVVKQDGIPVLGMNKEPFTIGQVAPERRWAVDHDGNLLSQTVFEELKKKGVLEYYEMLKAHGHPDARYTGNVAREPIPDVTYYVVWGVDPDNPEKLREIGFDPHGTDGAKVKKFHTADGDEIAASRIKVLSKAYADPNTRKQMKPEEIAEVEAYLGVAAGAGRDAVAAKLETLTELHKDGLLSDADYMAKVAALAGTGGAEVIPIRQEPEGEDEPEPEDDLPAAASDPGTASCGKAGFKPGAGVAAHERRCNRCRALVGLPPWKPKGAK